MSPVVKRQPEDFVVEELTERFPSRGIQSLYRLVKRSIGTPEAVNAVLRAWNVPRRMASWGGLKDRHALTVQYLTIQEGPRRDLDLPEIGTRLEFLGPTDRRFTPLDILGNRFVIIVRRLTEAALAEARARLDEVMRVGLVNYFDDQRFGSLTADGRWIAVPWMLGDYESALRITLCGAVEFDSPLEREQKQLCDKLWGDWPALKEQLERSNRRSIITYLVDHPTDFRRALALVSADIRALYLSAFQSHVWNRMLAGRIERSVPPSRRRALVGREGPLWIPTGMTDSERLELDQSVPLLSARQQDLPPDLGGIADQVLGRHGLLRRQMRVKYPRDAFFSKGYRTPLIRPWNLSADPPGPDSLYPGHLAWRLRFDLPRGCYATMLLKTLGFHQPEASLSVDDEAEESPDGADGTLSRDESGPDFDPPDFPPEDGTFHDDPRAGIPPGPMIEPG
jgi:tRNA pseudouridine13 synthase